MISSEEYVQEKPTIVVPEWWLEDYFRLHDQLASIIKYQRAKQS